MSKYIPFPFYYDDMPIDISSAFQDAAPAGRHGFMKVQGDKMIFEDGTPALFWGVNFNGGACFPSFDYSEKVASRLRKTGVNLVRFHQLDAEWDSPHIFAFQKGERIGSTTTFHPESMKRLDYLIACLKKEGIYCYLDMNTYRNFKSGDGVENAALLEDAADPYCYYDPKLIELQKKFIYDIWNHVNPYTGLAYKDDPVFVMSEIINERDFFSRKRFTGVEPYTTNFRNLYQDWLKEKGIPGDAYEIDLNDDTIDSLVAFKIEIQTRFYREMYDYMREVGVKIPICGNNWCTNGAVTKSNHEVNDFMDSHSYFYDWNWGEDIKKCANRGISQTPNFYMGLTYGLRALDRPLFVSEWDMPWPNSYRAESILYAAVGALQGYSGLAIHTYSYGTRLADMKILGKEVTSATIGNTPYREGIFSTWNDPAKYGLFYHAALMTRRQDVAVAPESVALKITNLVDREEANVSEAYGEWKRVGVTFEDNDPVADETISVEEAILPDTGEVRSVTGELYRSWKKNYGTIDTARTKVAYGFLQKNGCITMNGMEVNCDTDFAVIACSSLTNASIQESDNLLLTAVGRAENTDAKFDGDQLLDFGKPPVIIEVIEAEIKIAVNNPDMKVWAVNPEGMFVGFLSSQYKDGILSFRIGDTMNSMYYLIQAE